MTALRHSPLTSDLVPELWRSEPAGVVYVALLPRAENAPEKGRE